jgi:DNA invertase Pin-like site-specific DNA recombinase
VKIAYGYCRMSTDKQVLSVPAQQEAIRRHFEYLLVPRGFAWGGFYVDPGVSGKLPFMERAAGGELIQVADKGDAIIVAKLDRAFRSCLDACRIVGMWGEMGVEPHILDLGIDLSTPIGRCMMQVVAAFAELERGRISERTKDGFAEMRRRGWSLNGMIPYGTTWVHDGVNPRNGRIRRLLIVNHEERRVMAMIVGWRDVHKMSFGEIARKLKREVFIVRKNRKANEEPVRIKWTIDTVRAAYEKEKMWLENERMIDQARMEKEKEANGNGNSDG